MIEPVALTTMVLGAITGSVFAVVLMVAERRPSIDDLPAKRVALWGALAAVVLFETITALDVILNSSSEWLETAVIAFVISAPLGAISAIGTLALARRHSPAQ